MHHSSTSLTESISSLLDDLANPKDQEVLQPVIDSLLQEITFVENTNEHAYRQLISDIANFLLQSGVLSEDLQQHFIWLKKLSSNNHEICSLQALVKNFRTNKTEVINKQVVARETEKEAVNSIQSAALSSTEIEPEHLEAEINETQIHQALNTPSPAPETGPESQPESESEQKTLLSSTKSNAELQALIKDNQFNDAELKSLKTTLQERLDSTREQCHEFESLMKLLLSDLRTSQNPEELNTIKSMLKRAIEKLLEEQAIITTNIVDVATELNRFESHCDQLNHELGLVKRLSLTDELTRLPNRRAFIKRLQNESGRVQRYGYPLTVAILDLDLFKEINDTYGHSAGDEVLQAFTRNILSTFRNYDLVARYGGEEFAVLLPHTDIHGAERALNKVLERTINATIASSDNNAPIKLPTFSAGIAAYQEGESIESVINRADKAMYSAKKMGRNRVVVETE